jgi:hypothetical protein
MVRLLVTAAAAALLGTIASAGVANATPEARVPDLSKQIGDGEVGLSYAQYRRYNRGGRYGYYRRGKGGSAAGLIGGLAAGALITSCASGCRVLGSGRFLLHAAIPVVRSGERHLSRK